VASLVLGSLFFFGWLGGVPAVLLGLAAVRGIDRSGRRLRGRRLAAAGVALGAAGCVYGLFQTALWSSDGDALCADNLGRVGLALYRYHNAHGHFPAAATAGKDGRPLLSWRVALLPRLGAGELYAKFRLDEPWDSPHNLALLDAMPRVYACPAGAAREPGTTGYRVVVGPGTAFPPDLRPVALTGIADGFDVTLLVVESRRHVPWTKPDEVPFDAAVSPDVLGGPHGGRRDDRDVFAFHGLFADGSVRLLDRPDALRALLTRDGGEAVSPDEF